MAIAFPTFEDTFCQMVGICSHIKEATATPSLPSDDIDIVSTYRAHSGNALTRLVWNPASKHFHVDVALRAWFVKDPPRADTPIAKFRKTLAHFEGLTVAAYPHSYFIIPLSTLPLTGGLIFVGNSGIRLSTGRTEIELTGATLTFRRSGIHKIQWDLIEDREVLLNVDSKRQALTIGEDYLTEVLKVFNSAVSTYILGKKADGTFDA